MAAADDTRFDSWGEIAQHLRRDTRTVRRWEKEAGLPVHRVPGKKHRSVFAYQSEIDAWLRSCSNVSGQSAECSTVATLPNGNASTASAAVPKQTVSVASLDSAKFETTERGSEQGPGFGRPPVAIFWGQGIRVRTALALIALAIATVAVLGVFMRGRGKAAAPIVSRGAGVLGGDPANGASGAHNQWRPEILFMRFNDERGNLGLNMDGLGFGYLPTPLPFTGTLRWFRIGDLTCFRVSPGNCEAGFSGDNYPLTYASWSDNQVVISHYQIASPGDAVELAIWRPESKDTQDAAVWGGNIPPIKPGTPQISTVEFSGAGKDLHITVVGQGFGDAPPGVPGTGDTAFFRVGDYAFHSSDVQFSIFFRAGYRNKSLVDNITLAYSSWSDTKIEIAGFAGAYGNGLAVRRGDPISIALWSTRNGLATAWGGRIP